MKSENIRIAKKTDIFILDEASMLKSDKFDRLNFTLQ
jgi:hypothetical protein